MRGSIIQVLLVDIDGMFIDDVNQNLVKEDVSLCITQRSVDALASLGQSIVDIAIIAADCPEMDIHGFLTELRSRPETQFMPIILVTGESVSEEDVLRMKEAYYVSDYLKKPVDMVALFDRIETLTSMGLPRLRRNRRPSSDGCTVRVRCESRQILEDFYIKNLNQGGMFVETNMPVREETKVHLCISLPFCDAGEIEVDGTIVATADPKLVERRRQRQGFRVRFTDLSSDQRDSIQQLIQCTPSLIAAASNDASPQPPRVTPRQTLQPAAPPVDTASLSERIELDSESVALLQDKDVERARPSDASSESGAETDARQPRTRKNSLMSQMINKRLSRMTGAGAKLPPQKRPSSSVPSQKRPSSSVRSQKRPSAALPDIRSSGPSLDTLYKLGQTAYEESRFKDAHKIFTKLSRSYPAEGYLQVKMHVAHAQILKVEDKFDEALEALVHAIDIDFHCKEAMVLAKEIKELKETPKRKPKLSRIFTKTDD